MLEEDEDTPQEVLDDGEADMETERVDTTSHSRLSVKNGIILNVNRVDVN